MTGLRDTGNSPLTELHGPPDRVFRIGDRVRITYGPGTVECLLEDASGQGRPPIVGVHADIGQLWFRDPRDVDLLADAEARAGDEIA